MTDCNNKPANIGDRAVMLESEHDGEPGFSFAGKMGEIRDLKIRKEDGIERAHISGGLEDNWTWSAWCASKEFAII